MLPSRLFFWWPYLKSGGWYTIPLLHTSFWGLLWPCRGVSFLWQRLLWKCERGGRQGLSRLLQVWLLVRSAHSISTSGQRVCLGIYISVLGGSLLCCSTGGGGGAGACRCVL